MEVLQFGYESARAPISAVDVPKQLPHLLPRVTAAFPELRAGLWFGLSGL